MVQVPTPVPQRRVAAALAFSPVGTGSAAGEVGLTPINYTVLLGLLPLDHKVSRTDHRDRKLNSQVGGATMKSPVLGVLCLYVQMSFSTASAAVTVFTNEADFLAATTTNIFESFEQYADTPPGTETSYLTQTAAKKTSPQTSQQERRQDRRIVSWPKKGRNHSSP